MMYGDIQQIGSRANHQSLCSEEIYEILKNYEDYHMAKEPGQMPRSGSLYLFNTKKVKHFKRDGHNWKKRKGGKRDTEGYEKLKVGGKEVLRCYYNVGEENENFKRRIYSMLEKDLSHIVLVRYLEEKGTEEYRNNVESENEVDKSSVPRQVLLDSDMSVPSLSHDLLFSIFDIAPDWGYENSETKVLIIGRFLKGQDAERCNWSCMFGEVKVEAEVLEDRGFRCHAPAQKAGTLSFYVTCSNRPGLACSQEKKFEYRPKDYYSNCSTEALNMRFEELLSSSSTFPNCDSTSMAEDSELSGKSSSLLNNDKDQLDEILQYLLNWGRGKGQLQQLTEKFCAWIRQKLAAGGKGLSVLDEGGQGVLHFGAALGYDWVLLPMIMAGVSVDFRDVNGRTALHWAAFYSRHSTVDLLMRTFGAKRRALPYSTIRNPTSKAPADLASEQGHSEMAIINYDNKRKYQYDDDDDHSKPTKKPESLTVAATTTNNQSPDPKEQQQLDAVEMFHPHKLFGNDDDHEEQRNNDDPPMASVAQHQVVQFEDQENYGQNQIQMIQWFLNSDCPIDNGQNQIPDSFVEAFVADLSSVLSE